MQPWSPPFELVKATLPVVTQPAGVEGARPWLPAVAQAHRAGSRSVRCGSGRRCTEAVAVRWRRPNCRTEPTSLSRSGFLIVGCMPSRSLCACGTATVQSGGAGSSPLFGQQWYPIQERSAHWLLDDVRIPGARPASSEGCWFRSRRFRTASAGRCGVGRTMPVSRRSLRPRTVGSRRSGRYGRS
jgi:hypothetical protein